MLEWTALKNTLAEYPLAYDAAVIGGAVVISFIANLITKHGLLRGVHTLFSKLPQGDQPGSKLVLKIASRLANIVPAIVFYLVPAAIPDFNPKLLSGVHRICVVLIVFCSALALGSVLDLCNILYQRRPESQDKPIKGYLQLGKIFIGIVSVILAISILLDKSPVLLLSGLGAIAAVLMLIFQDTILSLVASIQLGSNDMVKIGDWIEMPAQHVDGYVIEIALHTIKVQNWDKTITTVPIRKLITETFINWRGMFESGGRRIKRSIYLDQRSIRFLTDGEIRSLEEFMLLNDYLEEKKKELADWNRNLEEKGAKSINGRRITNIGTFRIYVEKYLKSNPAVNQDMLLLVRQLQPGATGLPLEIYCFTKDTRWVVYEQVQADIFDHLLAILPVFGLRVFQQCSDTSGIVINSAPAAKAESNVFAGFSKGIFGAGEHSPNDP